MERTKRKEILSLKKTGCHARRKGLWDKGFRAGRGMGVISCMYKRRRKEFWGCLVV